MGRKKHLSLLILVLLCTCSQIFAATTYYEIWRSETNDPGTAVPIAQDVMITEFLDPSAVAEQNYYYWVKVKSEATDAKYNLRPNGNMKLQVEIDTPTTAVRGQNTAVTLKVTVLDDGYINHSLSGQIKLYLIEDDPWFNNTIQSWTFTGSSFYTGWSETRIANVDIGPHEPDNDIAEIFAEATHIDTAAGLDELKVWTNAIDVQLLDSPSAAPSNVNASNNRTDGIRITWNPATGNSNFSASALGWMTSSTLSAPSLISPSNESTVNGTEIIFQWGPSSGATNYHIQIATDSSFNNEFLAYDSDVGNSTSFQGTGFPDNGMRFYWRVKAGNSSGWSGYQNAWYFYNGTTLTVNSSGASGVSISSVTEHGGTTNYTLTNIESGTFVHLRAPYYVGTGTSRMRFDGWTGSISSSEEAIAFTMNGGKSLTANYISDPEAVWYVVSISSTGASGVSISGTHRGTTPYSLAGIIYGSVTVNLQAPYYVGTGASRMRFDGWTGAMTSSSQSITFTIYDSDANPDRGLTAHYVSDPETYTLSVNSSGASGVGISSSTSHDGITNYTKTLVSGTNVTLTAPSSASGKIFNDWTGSVSSSNQTISLTMSEDKAVTANYEVAGSLTVNINPQESIDAGAQWQLTSGPDTGMKNSGETINNIPIGSYTLQFNDIPGFEEPIAHTVEIYQGTNTEPGIYSSIYSGGTGVENDPFIIASPNDLLDMSGNPASMDKHFILTENIDLVGYVFGEGVIPGFSGVFNGNGNKITNLIIDIGLISGFFRSIDSGGEVNNLGIENCLVNSDWVAGGLVGINNGGNINNCYVIGLVNSAWAAGGLVGLNDGLISNCYASGLVSSPDYVGGLVGYNGSGNISNCYSAGDVFGEGNPGGLVGLNDGNIINSFWDAEISGITGAAGITTVQMQNMATFINAGWDFNDLDGDAADWKIRDGFGYPLLSWQEYLIGDFAGDYSVNLIDFSVFAASWMSQFGDSDFNVDCDLDDSGDSNDVIDLADLMVFCDNWLEGTSEVVDTNDGLITYYKFDGTSGPVIDETGNNDGNNVNDSATRGVTGKVGNAFYFDGSSSWVESDSNIGITANSDWTISFWMYTNNPLDASNLISLGTYDTPFEIIGIAPGQTNTQLFVNLWEPSWNEYFNVGIDLTGEWNHIAATYDGTNIEFFVNGYWKGNKTVTLNLTSDKIRIGGRTGGYDGQYYDGWIDEVKIWNRTLSDSEVQYLFQHP